MRWNVIVPYYRSGHAVRLLSEMTAAALTRHARKAILARLPLNEPRQKDRSMKRPHLAAALCFAIAGIFYIAGLSNDYLVGFLVLGLGFEVAAWVNVIKASREKRAG